MRRTQSTPGQEPLDDVAPADLVSLASPAPDASDGTANLGAGAGSPPVVEAAPLGAVAPPSPDGAEGGETVVVVSRVFGASFAKMKRTLVRRGYAMVGAFIEMVGGR